MVTQKQDLNAVRANVISLFESIIFFHYSSLYQTQGALLVQIINEEGLLGLCEGFDAMLFKQIPYTMTKQVSFEMISSSLALYISAHASFSSQEGNLSVTIISAFLASILACVVSNPGDVIVVKKFKERTNGNVLQIASNINENEGIDGFLAGFSARLFHVISIVTTQLVLYDLIKKLLGLPSTM